MFSTDLHMGQEMDNWPLPGKDFSNEEIFGFTINILAEGWRKASQFIISAALFLNFIPEISNGNAGL